MILYVLALVNSAIELGRWSYDKAIKIKAAIESVFRPNYYIFFKGTPYAYDSAAVTTYGTASREVEWVYSPTDQAFFAWNNTIFSSIHNYANATHPIPVLSLEIIDKETQQVQYDLTEFLEKMSVRAPADKHRNPSVAEILAAWAMHSSIVVDPACFSVRLMDSAANEVETAVDDQAPLSCVSNGSESNYDADSTPTESEATESEATESEATESEATESEATESEATESSAPSDSSKKDD